MYCEQNAATSALPTSALRSSGVGVTGHETQWGEKFQNYIAEIRKHTDLPLAVGFGVRTPDDLNALAGKAEVAAFCHQYSPSIPASANHSKFSRLNIFKCRNRISEKVEADQPYFTKLMQVLSRWLE